VIGPLIIAGVLYLVWTGVTYLMEGRIRTLLRPEAMMARLAYGVVANMLIGTAGAVAAIVLILGIDEEASAMAHGFASPTRTVISIVAGLVLGGLVFALQRPPSRNMTVLANGYAQTLVVSVAEVLVCWSVLGATVETTLASAGPALSVAAGLLVAALAFGLYHFAHSPPFNTMRLVLLLSGVGLISGAFFFISRDVYGTILFHNFLALKGVTQALADSGRLGSYERVQWQLMAMAMAAILLLVILNVVASRVAGQES